MSDTAQSTDRAGRRRWLVFGASGYVGSRLVPWLLAAWHPVRAAARNPAALEGRGWDDVELVAADALEPATLPQALEGVEVAFYLVHSMAAGPGFASIDLEAARNFAAAAARADVKRIVYLGGLLPPDASSEHLVSRADTGAELRRGTVPVTEIRAGIIVGPGSAAFEVIRDLVNNLPVMTTPRWVRSRTPPIALQNLLAYLEGVAQCEEAAGGIYDAAGPEMLSYEELMRQYGAIVGRRPRIIAVPVLTVRLSALWLGLVTTVPTSVARALIGGLAHDIPADPEPLRRLLPQRLLDFRESVLAALEMERIDVTPTHWLPGPLLFRGGRADHSYYAKTTIRSASARVSAASVWRVITSIGGGTGYFTARFPWTLRGALDWIVGGPGLRRGRPHPSRLEVGDDVDFWRVLAMVPGRSLTLGSRLRAPGSGVLELTVTEDAPQAVTVQVAGYWHPAGLWGLLYWYALAPLHLLLFRAMARGIVRRAVELDRSFAAPDRLSS
jgi:uncharacterized protein YbjT (DUF2867 family)